MSTAVRTRPLAQPASTPAPGRRTLRTAVVSLLAVGVVGGGVWGLTAPRETHEADHAGSVLATVQLPDGTLRVDGLVDKQVGTMPGMDMPEDVPAGLRRFAVDVSLGATEDEALRYDRRDFTVSGSGVKPVVPVDGQLDRGELTPGSTISGSLTFDVPEEATALTLRFRGEAVALPALPAATGSGRSQERGAEAPATGPKAPAPAADDHDAPGTPPH